MNYRGKMNASLSPVTSQSFFSTLPEQLKGNHLQSRFLVGSQIGIGSFGMVFKVMDVWDGRRMPMALKISTNVD